MSIQGRPEAMRGLDKVRQLSQYACDNCRRSPWRRRVTKRLPHLSRFEMQCLRRLWSLGEGSVRAIRETLPDPPSYSTVRKIVERLEEKGAVSRARLEGKAWVYRPAIGATTML